MATNKFEVRPEGVCFLCYRTSVQNPANLEESTSLNTLLTFLQIDVRSYFSSLKSKLTDIDNGFSDITASLCDGCSMMYKQFEETYFRLELIVQAMRGRVQEAESAPDRIQELDRRKAEIGVRIVLDELVSDYIRKNISEPGTVIKIFTLPYNIPNQLVSPYPPGLVCSNFSSLADASLVNQTVSTSGNSLPLIFPSPRTVLPTPTTNLAPISQRSHENTPKTAPCFPATVTVQACKNTILQNTGLAGKRRRLSKDNGQGISQRCSHCPSGPSNFPKELASEGSRSYSTTNNMAQPQSEFPGPHCSKNVPIFLGPSSIDDAWNSVDVDDNSMSTNKLPECTTRQCTIYSCNECKSAFKSKLNLENHVKFCQRITCRTCGAHFTGKSRGRDLVEHVSSHKTQDYLRALPPGTTEAHINMAIQKGRSKYCLTMRSVISGDEIVNCRLCRYHCSQLLDFDLHLKQYHFDKVAEDMRMEGNANDQGLIQID